MENYEIAKTLYLLQKLEENRISQITSDLKDITPFKNLEREIQNSLAMPSTPQPISNQQPANTSRTQRDEELIQKILKARKLSSLSSRIIRP